MSTIFKTVVAGDYCVGCGICAAAARGIKMVLTPSGQYQPEAVSFDGAVGTSAVLDQVCPFSDQSENEDEIANRIFGEAMDRDHAIGAYLENYIGHVANNGFRERGSSGGMGTWILHELMRQNFIDGVIHVHASNGGDTLFEFRVSRSLEDVKTGSKSRYYPVEVSGVLDEVRKTPGRYAIVGLPCFIKGIRLLTKFDEVLRDRIVFCIGLVCGHLKTTQYADFLAWQAALEPNNLRKIDFRQKLAFRAASSYGYTVEGVQNGGRIYKTRPMASVVGGDWGMGLFKLKACDYCDDVIAETADMVVGDAWLPKFKKDYRGTNIVVVRNRRLLGLIEEGIKRGDLSMEKVGPKEIAASQDAGLRHRRIGLSWRLQNKINEGEWCPPKRVKANEHDMEERRKRLYSIREVLRDVSVAAFGRAREAKDLSHFWDVMKKPLADYSEVMGHRAPSRIIDPRVIIRKFKKMLSRYIVIRWP